MVISLSDSVENNVGTRYVVKSVNELLGNKITTHFVRLRSKRYSFSISVINYAFSAKINAKARVHNLMVNKHDTYSICRVYSGRNQC